MKRNSYQFEFEVFHSKEELNAADREMLLAAREATKLAYAPYSSFNVGAAAKLANGQIVSGGNQENASFPAGLCAEGVVLAMAAARYPGVGIDTLAISYTAVGKNADQPIAPCGICRQSMQEFAQRTGRRMRLLMGGESGDIIVVPDASLLLPFAFRFS